ncbi:hypothetical protein OH77DRAFT_192347 [Trametes cingulata]|nr:hypothetical protein OH77DRAFT_192347 [Trametes cingulata]
MSELCSPACLWTPSYRLRPRVSRVAIVALALSRSMHIPYLRTSPGIKRDERRTLPSRSSPRELGSLAVHRRVRNPRLSSRNSLPVLERMTECRRTYVPQSPRVPIWDSPCREDLCASPSYPISEACQSVARAATP